MARAVEPLVRVEEIFFPPIRPDRLVDCHLEQPRLGDTSDIYALRICGRATGAGQRVTRFELVQRGAILETVLAIPSPADEFAGSFDFAVSSVDLPYAFNVVVRAVLENQRRVRVARLSGTREALPRAPASGPSPVLIGTIGRSGSTALTSLLGHHPEIAGYRTRYMETRMVSYWTSVLRALARPTSYKSQLAPGSLRRNWWLGEHPLAPDVPDGDPMVPMLGRDGVEALASFCRSQIGLLGSSLAAAEGKPDAQYLVEKAPVDGVRSVAEVCEELDARTCEIVLVRDFRDVACSMVSYAQQNQVHGFGPRVGASIEEMIRWISATGVKGLVDYIERRGAQTHVLRYEDLMTTPEAALTDVLEHIGADRRPQTVALMLERLAAEREYRDAHATTDSPESSLGRWRRDLDADQQALAEQHLRPHLDALGYD